jgi:hypothetical protein
MTTNNRKPLPAVFTMVVFAGDHDALHLTEDHRKYFATARAARTHARYRVSKAGGAPAAAVFAGIGPTNPIAEHVASYASAARRRFYRAIAALRGGKK